MAIISTDETRSNRIKIRDNFQPKWYINSIKNKSLQVRLEGFLYILDIITYSATTSNTTFACTSG